MRAKEFILKEDILNEVDLSDIKNKVITIYKQLSAVPGFVETFNKVRSDKQLINSIITKLKQEKNLTKEKIVDIIKLSVPSLAESITEAEGVDQFDKQQKLSPARKAAGAFAVMSMIGMFASIILAAINGFQTGSSSYNIATTMGVVSTIGFLISLIIASFVNFPKMSTAVVSAIIGISQLPPAPSDNASTPEISNAKFMGSASSKEEIIYNMAGELYNMRMQRIPLVSAEKYIKEKYQGKQLKMANAVLDYIYAYSPETLAMIKDPEELQQQIRRNVANYY